MIKLKDVNKYFNKNRSNQNHVIKNTSIEFPESGLVVFLGSSGSGKTTLLNVISGMDKFNSGEITIDDKIISKYNANKWDEIRNDYIGYIFQNYNLLKELSVQDNIELVLRINGITDEEEINKRVDYLLKEVGLINYNNRRADQLSGGQQQRVAFARALVKNPKIIIADEPTGNLDSKTTIEIMNIIKQISKDKLVIMVTHEQDLAEFYADRIIEIANGNVISDVKNEYAGNLSIIQEQIIFLKDLSKSSLVSEEVDLLVYSDEQGKKLDKIGVQVIKRNETLYIKVNSTDYKRIKYIDNESEIELVDSHYKATEIEESSFDFGNEIVEAKDKKKRGVITIKDSFKYALRKMSKINAGGKMLYVVLGLVGAVLSVSVGLIGHISSVDESEFVNTSRNYIRIFPEKATVLNNVSYEEIFAFEDYDFIEKVSLFDEFKTFNIETELYYEIKGSIEIEAHPTQLLLLNPNKIIYGDYPGDTYGIVIDYTIADQLIKDYSHRGIETYKDILDCSFKLQSSGKDFDVNDETSLNFPIVGIANDASPTVWMKPELIYSLVMPSLIDPGIFGGGFELATGTMPNLSKKVLMSAQSPYIRDNGVPSNVGLQSGRYDVSGTYTYTDNGKFYDSSLLYVSNLEFMQKEYFNTTQYAFVNFSFLAYAEDPELALVELEKLGIEATSDYLDDYDKYASFEFEQNAAYYIFALVGVVTSSISIYFIMRSSLISRIYEVSVYRALGATKNNIRKMFIVEVILTTTISSIIGYFAMIILLLRAQSQVIEYFELVRYPILLTLGGVLGIYVINTFFGLLPINLLLRKTPAAILSKYDL